MDIRQHATSNYMHRFTCHYVISGLWPPRPRRLPAFVQPYYATAGGAYEPYASCISTPLVTVAVLVLCWQFNISNEWYTWENDTIGFANLGDVELVTYNASGDADSTRWADAENAPQTGDFVSFSETSENQFSVAVRIDQSMFQCICVS